MKNFLALTFLVSSSVFACPDLTGTFICKFNNNISQKEIVKTDNGFFITSEGNTVEYITDGKTYEIPSTDSYKDAKIKATCSDNEMVVDFNASILYEGSVIAKQVSKVNYSMNDNNLLIQQKTKMKGIPLPAVLWKCERK